MSNDYCDAFRRCCVSDLFATCTYTSTSKVEPYFAAHHVSVFFFAVFFSLKTHTLFLRDREHQLSLYLPYWRKENHPNRPSLCVKKGST
jgi:hypothetical protein